ncbi:MAG: radical SAM family heme chaperone HemW [Cyanobacteria bacterium P01_H01_bin.119]
MGSPQSAYVHIPFCRRRCYYCDFPISVLGDRRQGDASDTVNQYIEQILREIRATHGGSQPALKTVFFGGGTPSLLSVGQLERILSALYQQFGLIENAEISMEMDPGTFDLAQAQGYRRAGVNRVSLGAQAFQAELLVACGRTHGVDEIQAAFEILDQVGMPSVSLDLISGLPHQTLNIWRESLSAAIALQPQHISVYDLTVEPQTAFGKWYQAGQRPLPTDDLTVAMYRIAGQTLIQAGYEHYEVSNYAQPSHRCRHNLTYWRNRPYYAFGMGATSYVNNQRFGRPRTLRDYSAWVDTYEAAQGAIACEPTPWVETLLDRVMVGLRLSEGILLSELTADYGEQWCDRLLACLNRYKAPGWIVIDDQRVRLSDPEGFLFSNVVLSTVFEQLANDCSA